MHEVIIHVSCRRPVVRLGAEPSQAFLVDVDAHRAHSVDQYVDSQIILEIVHEVRSVQVVLDYPTADALLLLTQLDIIEDLLDLAAEKDTSALCQAIRFYYVCLSLVSLAVYRLLKLVLEVNYVAGEHPSLWEEVELFWKGTLHAHQVPRQVILLRERVHAGVVIDFLVRIHLSQEVSCDGKIVP